MTRVNVFHGEKLRKRGRVHLARFIIKTGLLAVLLTGAVFSGISCYDWALSSPFFSVKLVEISPMLLMKEGDILDISGFSVGENLFEVNREEMESRLEAYPWISEASVVKKFPDKLLITVNERFPFAIISSDKRYLVDREGFTLSILGKVPKLSIPVIGDRKGPSLLPGDRLETPAFFAGREAILAASGKLLNYESYVASVELLGSGRVRVFGRNSSVPILLDRFNIEEGFSKLNYMKNVLDEEGVSEVDLSFRNQVVVKREVLKDLGGNLAFAGEL